MHLSTTPRPPRLWEVWDAVKTRLSTARMTSILGGAGRIYLPWDDYGKDEDVRTAPWGRLIIRPVRKAWPTSELGGRERLPLFLLVTEFSSPGGGWNPARAHEDAHDEGFLRLEGWIPTGLTKVAIQFPIHRRRAPFEVPERDPERGLWLNSSEFGTVVKPA